MEALQKFTEKKCLNPDVKLDYSVQVLAGSCSLKVAISNK